jgi:hypothetical protein
MLTIVGVAFILAGQAGGATYLVDPNGFADFTTIQAAISDPCTVDGDEIEVAPGTYPEAIDFGGKAITLRSTDPNDPNVVAATIINGSYNKYHVVKCVSGEDANTVLEGFTITGGNANGASWPEYYGGGMYNDGSSPTVTNCNFSSNWAADSGGGMMNHYANPTVTNCTFSWNVANNGGGMYNYESSPNVSNCTFGNNAANVKGGGMYNNVSSPKVTNCIFSVNTATTDGGGGMMNHYGNPTVTNCTFSWNSTLTNGGGIYNYQSSPAVVNCMFSNNPAQYGGGMCNYNYSSPTVTNCTFNGNSATTLGGGILNNLSSSPTLTNCILWGNLTEQIVDYDYPSSSTTATYCDVEGDWGGAGSKNIEADPLFVDAGGGDLSLSSCSPCVDAGDNNSVAADSSDLDGDGNTIEPVPFDLAGNARFVDDTGVTDTGAGTAPIVDMGAYERQSDSVGSGTINVPGDFGSIQEAISEACPGDEIVVAPGTYNEAINFGGKAVRLYSSGGPGVTTIHGSYNNYHVVKCVSGEDANTVLEGFTITGGNANGAVWPDYHGGGMLNDGSSPTVTNCIFSGNWAADGGGGMMNHYANPTVTNCTFSWNVATDGGGMYNYESSPTVANCTFSLNIAGINGGGMYNSNNSPTVSGCLFYRNTTMDGQDYAYPRSDPHGAHGGHAGHGGGIYNDCSSPVVSYCDFVENRTGNGGKGYRGLNGSRPAGSGGWGGDGGYGGCGAGMYNYLSSPTISYCNFRLNETGDGGIPGHGGDGGESPIFFAHGGDGGSGGHAGGGAGMYNNKSSPVVNYCDFTQNSTGSGSSGGYGGDAWRAGNGGHGGIGGSGGNGAGMYNSDSTDSTVYVTSCSFTANVTGYGGDGGDGGDGLGDSYGDGGWGRPGGSGGNGAGMYNSDSSLAIANCSFKVNGTGYGGDGGYGGYGHASDGHGPGGHGGDGGGGAGLYNSQGDPNVTNCNFGSNATGNGGDGGLGYIATGDGGDGGSGAGMYNTQGDPNVTNCTFSGNTTGDGGVGFDGYPGNGGGMCNIFSSPIVNNCILWDDTPDEIYKSNSSPIVTYCNVQGGYAGAGNINADPCFVTGPLGDYYLSQVAAGEAANSPCVDAGSDTAANLGMDESTTRTDQAGDEGTVDMGYHYRLPEPWDLNGDWKVSFIDFGILGEQWLQAPGTPSADIVPPEGDGVVDGLDLGLLVDYWLWEE